MRSLTLLCWLVLPLTGAAAQVPVVEANDNQIPAGILAGGVLTLDLEIRTARWYPEDAEGPWVDVPVFAEVGKPPQVPGPLIRVPVGTEVRASIRNTLPDSTINLYGFQSRPASGGLEGVTIPPGETRTVTFRVEAEGTFLYSARTTRTQVETEQLAGALVVDPKGPVSDDRIMVINIWSVPIDSVSGRHAFTINGKSWPHTERIRATVGDTVRWRVVNASTRGHPMHLHGFFFRVDSRGNGIRDTVYTAEQRRLAVTETMAPRSTMALTWVPETPGNWLFHCHLSFHVIPGARLDPPEDSDHLLHSSDIGDHMAGLVMGIQVDSRPGVESAPRRNVREVYVSVQEGTPQGRAPRAMRFVVEGQQPVVPDSPRMPGSVLVLTRGQPTDVTVHNRMSEPTSIHWHGLELESWSDGVAGWSGSGARVAPAIPPGGSFTARLTLKRAGTFIYHTHLNDIEQITSGLYGPILVLEPGERYDPTRDFVFLMGWDGLPEGNGPDMIVVNGGRTEVPLELRRGERYRFRFINIGPAGRFGFRIVRGDSVANWRPIAKDGADLPAHQAIVRQARIGIDVGETFDAEFIPEEAGEYLLLSPGPGDPFYQRRLIVR